MKDIVSLNEKEFIIEALHSRVRIDGRGMYDYRTVSFHFGKARGNVEVHLGGTRVYCSVIAEVQPRADKPTEGIFYFDINFSPIADPGFDGRTPEQAIEVARVIEKGLKESKAIDPEELCILAGAQVWSIRVMITVLDNDGNLCDSAGLAAIAALLDFRRPDVTVIGDLVTVYDLRERDPVALSVHHCPVPVTFCFASEYCFVIDPVVQEEEITRGFLTVMVNDFSEVCLIEKPGGIAVGIDAVLNCAQLAVTKGAELIAELKRSLAEARPPPPPLKVKRVGERPGEQGKLVDAMDLDRPIG